MYTSNITNDYKIVCKYLPSFCTTRVICNLGLHMPIGMVGQDTKKKYLDVFNL